MRLKSKFLSDPSNWISGNAASLRGAKSANHARYAARTRRHGPRATQPSALGAGAGASAIPLFTLEEAQRLATESNPTLRQAEAEIRAAKARQQQSALYPNPSIGYIGDEIRGGSINGGKQGFFVQQTIVTGGKLSKARDVFAGIAISPKSKPKNKNCASKPPGTERPTCASLLLRNCSMRAANLPISSSNSPKRIACSRNTGQADETEVLTAELATRNAAPRRAYAGK